MFDPLYAVALVCHEPPDGKLLFVSTCFAFRRRTIFLTADHSVRGLPASEVRLLCQLSPTGSYLRVEDIQSHPRADVAILRTPEPGLGFDPFSVIMPGRQVGNDYMIYGFPEDLLLPPFNPPFYTPDGRLLKGYLQRFFTHRLRAPYEYLAAELSVACPRGLSGAPLFAPGGPVVGLVTGEFETTTPHGTVISYGVTAVLDDLRAWLDQEIPPR